MLEQECSVVYSVSYSTQRDLKEIKLQIIGLIKFYVLNQFSSLEQFKITFFPFNNNLTSFYRA